jgi:hypothetical protein
MIFFIVKTTSDITATPDKNCGDADGGHSSGGPTVGTLPACLFREIAARRYLPLICASV